MRRDAGPTGWAPSCPKYYWQIRLLPTYIPPPAPSASGGSAKGTGANAGKDDDNDEAHLAADLATALTANAPKGAQSGNLHRHGNLSEPRCLQVSRRQEDDPQYNKNKPNEVAILHEPNISVQISPDPNNQAAYQAAITLINVHMKRNWGLVKPDTRPVSRPGGVLIPRAQPPAQPPGSGSSRDHAGLGDRGSLAGFGPKPKPGDPPDLGAFHFAKDNLDMAFTPFTIGLLGHWDRHPSSEICEEVNGAGRRSPGGARCCCLVSRLPLSPRRILALPTPGEDGKPALARGSPRRLRGVFQRGDLEGHSAI